MPSAPIVAAISLFERLDLAAGGTSEISVLVSVPKPYLFRENPVELGGQLALE